MSKITDCFIHDNIGGSYLAVYDANRNGPTYYATRYGFDSQIGKGLIDVPLFPFSDVEVHDRCILLLLESVEKQGWRYERIYENVEREFHDRELRLHHVLTSSDHHLIPPGRRIAVAEPEYLGRIIQGNGTKRGVVLFNPEAVLGYEGRGRTAYEFVLQDFLAA